MSTLVEQISQSAKLVTLPDIYLRLKTVANFASVMGEEWFALNFDFFSKGLRGIDEPEELWKRAISATNGTMGELLGQLYVDKHLHFLFSP